MPSTAYSQIVAELAREATVVCYDHPAPLNAESVADLADRLGVVSMGYFGHSSVRPELLRSPVLEAFVLCDPSTLPVRFAMREGGFVQRSLHPSAPVLSIRAEFTASSPVPFVPRPFSPQLASATEVEYPGVGHADILDDSYATMCHRIGIRGTTVDHARRVRAEYRAAVGSAATQFLLRAARCADVSRKEKDWRQQNNSTSSPIEENATVT